MQEQQLPTKKLSINKTAFSYLYNPFRKNMFTIILNKKHLRVKRKNHLKQEKIERNVYMYEKTNVNLCIFNKYPLGGELKLQFALNGAQCKANRHSLGEFKQKSC
jgi:hypothetical protein